MFPVSPPLTPAPQLPVSLLPSESPAGAHPPPLLSAGPPQTRLTGAPARAGGHPSVFTSLSHAGIFSDWRFFWKALSTLSVQRYTRLGVLASRRKHFCPGNTELSLWEVSVTLTASLLVYIYISCIYTYIRRMYTYVYTYMYILCEYMYIPMYICVCVFVCVCNFQISVYSCGFFPAFQSP